MSIRPSPVRASTSIAVLVFDWLVFALNMTMRLQDFTASTLLGACAAGLTVSFIEQRHDASAWQLITRGLLAAAVVAAPLPLLGTALAAVFLTWSAVAQAQSPRTH